MTIVTPINLFSEEENLGELEKLAQILSILPAENLLKKLDDERENSRNDYPIVCMWRLSLQDICGKMKKVVNIKIQPFIIIKMGKSSIEQKIMK